MRQNGRDVRRRRVLLEEQATNESRRERNVRADRDNPYQEAARSERQPKLLDLIPTRLSLVIIVALTHLTIFASFHALHAHFYADASPNNRAWLAYFDLTRAGSLASWYASGIFGVMAALCGALYSVRRHRRDDFQGKYRIWPWLAGFFLVLSAASATELLPFVGETVRRLASTAPGLDGLTWSAQQWGTVVAVTLLSGVMLRSWFEFRESKAATVLVATAYLLWTASAVCDLGWVLPPPVDWETASFAHLAISALLTAFLCFSRYVILDAHGQIEHRASTGRRSKKSRRERKAEKREAKIKKQEARKQKEAETADSDSSDEEQDAEEAPKRRSKKKRRDAVKPEGTERDASESEGRRSKKRSAPIQIRRDTVTEPASERDRGNGAGGDGAEDGNGLESGSQGDDAFVELSEEEVANLSKADRRRYRKQQRRQRRAA